LSCPTTEENSTASPTPATTLMTRSRPLARMLTGVSWIMSSAVSGASNAGTVLDRRALSRPA
jgi:hypothetical protein